MFLVDHLSDPESGEIVPITLVTDNGGPFRSFRFEHFITAHPELRHVRTRVRTPGQNGVRERAFQSLKYELLYREQIDDALDLVREADAYRAEFNTIRPHQALSWDRLSQVHRGLADPTIPNFPEPEILPTSWRGTSALPLPGFCDARLGGSRGVAGPTGDEVRRRAAAWSALRV